MKIFKHWGKLGLALLALVSLGLAVLFAQPADAMMPKYERLVAMGIVDGIATPHELGLDYLEREPVELVADAGLIQSIQYVEEQYAVMPEDIPLTIPLGTNSPIAIGRIPNDTGSPQAVSNTICEGYVNASGQTKGFTPNEGRNMANTEGNNGGNITMKPDAQYIVMADAKGLFAQNRRVPTFTLIVRRGNQRFVVPRVNANAFCRDSLNAVLNRTLRRL